MSFLEDYERDLEIAPMRQASQNAADIYNLIKAVDAMAVRIDKLETENRESRERETKLMVRLKKKFTELENGHE